MKGFVSIILLNFNNNNLTIECLESLLKQKYKHFEVIIIDNGSKSSSYLKLKDSLTKFRTHLDINLIRSDYKLYFAGGTNKALKLAKGDYLCLLSNDMEVNPDFLESIVDYLNNEIDIGMLCPKIMYFNNKNLIWYAGAYINPLSINFIYHIGLNQEDKGQYDEILETGYANGAALFTTRKVVEEIGLMDEIFFMYTEETDWNFRAKKKGYKLIYYPRTTTYHKVNLITKKNRSGYRDNPFQIYLYNRNKIIFTIKHYSLYQILIFFCMYQLKTTIFEIILSLYKKQPKYILAYIRAMIMGIIIGFRRKTHRKCKKIMKIEYTYINSFNKYRN